MQESWGKRKGPNMGRPGSRTAREESLMMDETAAGTAFQGPTTPRTSTRTHTHARPRPTRASLPENPSRLGDADCGCRVSTVRLGAGRHTKET